MDFSGRFWFVMAIAALVLTIGGCSSEDGGVTDPLPDVTPKGDLQVHPDSLGTMAPLNDAMSQAQPGYVIVVFPGIYSGTLVIDKPVRFVSSAGKENTILENTSGGAAVQVGITGSYGPVDSLVFEGFGINGSELGIQVDAVTVPLAMRKCDMLDNASNGLVFAQTGGKVPGDGTLVLWQCFFRRNGLNAPSGSPAPASAAIWWTGTLVAESIFFESNAIDLALSDGAQASVRRMTTAESTDASLWMEGASNLVLDGVDQDIPTTLRHGTGWAAVVADSRLEIIDYSIASFGGGGIDLTNATLVLDGVTMESNAGYGIRSVSSVDSLRNSHVLSTGATKSGQSGYGAWVEGSGGPTVFHLAQSSIEGSFRSGVQASGAVVVELRGSTLKANGVGWSNDPDLEDPQAPVGGGIGLSMGATLDADASSLINLNMAGKGGGVAVVDPSSSAVFNASTVEKNSALEMGGGIAVVSGTARFNQGELLGNSSKDSGGGVAVVSEGSFDADGTTISGNKALVRGGGAFISEGHGGFTGGVQFLGNEGRDPDLKTGSGGGIYIVEADLLLDGAVFETNLSEQGAAIYGTNLRDDVIITNCSFQKNITGNATVYVRDLTRDLTLQDCLLVGNKLNSPTGNGSTAVFSRQDLPGGSLILLGCTIANNQGGSGAILHRSGNMVLNESVIAFNRPSGLFGTDLTFVAMDCDDFWDNGDFDYGPGADPGPNSFFADPLFCDLDNGVFTVDATSPLLPGNNTCSTQIGALGAGCGQGF